MRDRSPIDTRMRKDTRSETVRETVKMEGQLKCNRDCCVARGSVWGLHGKCREKASGGELRVGLDCSGSGR